MSQIHDQQLEKMTQEMEQEIYDEKESEFLSLSELLKKEFTEDEWLVERLIPLGGTTVLSGSPASYKTWLIIDIALKVASGERLFDKFSSTQAGVLIIDEESGIRLLQQRLLKMGASSELPIYFHSQSEFKLTEDAVESILPLISKEKISLVIIDSLVRIHTGDENDAVGMAKVANLMRRFNKLGITILFTHHHRKGGNKSGSGDQSQEMRGSSEILAAVDCHLSVKCREKFIDITQTKIRNDERLSPFTIEVISDAESFQFEYKGEVEKSESKEDLARVFIRHVIMDASDPLTHKQLCAEVKTASGNRVGTSIISKVINSMVEEGDTLEEQKGVKNAKLLVLKQPEL